MSLRSSGTIFTDPQGKWAHRFLQILKESSTWAGLSQEMDSFTNIMQTQIKRTIMFAINDEVIPEIQRVEENLPIREDNFGAGLSTFRQVFGDQLDQLKLI